MNSIRRRVNVLGIDTYELKIVKVIRQNFSEIKSMIVSFILLHFFFIIFANSTALVCFENKHLVINIVCLPKQGINLLKVGVSRNT